MILIIFCAFCLIIAGYSIFVEPLKVQIRPVHIKDDNLHRIFHNKKVVQISDLHITSVGVREKRLIKMLNKIEPDFLFITGDLLTNGKDEDSAVEVLRRINKPSCGIWLVLGNSDKFLRNGDSNLGVKRFVSRLKALEINVLEDAWASIDLGGEGDPLFIIGVEGFSLSRAKLERLMAEIPPSSPVILLSHYPNVLEDQPDALVVNLGSDNNMISGWGWKDSAYFEYDTGILRFEKNGKHIMRIQSRERGVSIEQVCLVALSDQESGTMHSKSRIPEEPEIEYSEINPLSNPMVIIKAKDIPETQVFGSWKKGEDVSAAHNPVLKDVISVEDKNEWPLLDPKDYFESSFYAREGIDYHFWMKMKADNDSPFHDSVYVQFNDSIDREGHPIYRINEYGVRKRLSEIDLILAGHTHGGQIRIPFTLKLMNLVLKPKIIFDKGLFDSHGTKLYVNSGIGTAYLPIRFLCPPEITVLRFERE